MICIQNMGMNAAAHSTRICHHIFLQWILICVRVIDPISNINKTIDVAAKSTTDLIYGPPPPTHSAPANEIDFWSRW